MKQGGLVLDQSLDVHLWLKLGQGHNLVAKSHIEEHDQLHGVDVEEWQNSQDSFLLLVFHPIQQAGGHYVLGPNLDAVGDQVEVRETDALGWTGGAAGERHGHNVIVGIEAISSVGCIKVASVPHHKGAEAKAIFGHLDYSG